MRGSDYQKPVYASVPAPYEAQDGIAWVSLTWRRLPLAGIGALVLASACMLSAIAVVFALDGMPVGSWAIQPTVWLSIFSTLASMALYFALAEGVRVTWWRHAINGDVTLAELHRFWDHSTSVFAALTAGRNMNMVAIACVLATVTGVKGPLLQRASSVGTRNSIEDITLDARMARNIGIGWAGTGGTRDKATQFFTSQFATVVDDWINKRDLPLNSTGCKGFCDIPALEGFGFDVACTTQLQSFSFAIGSCHDAITNGTIDVYKNGTKYNCSNFTSYPNPVATVFDIGISYYYPREQSYPENMIEFNTAHKETRDCQGDIIVQNCTLTPAIVKYHTILYANKSSHIRAVALALRNQYKTQSLMGWDSMHQVYGWNNAGAAAGRYAQPGNPPSVNDSFYPSCNVTFLDPVTEIVDRLHDLTLRIALAAAKPNDLQRVEAYDTIDRIVYFSHYHYAIGAVAITFSAIFTIGALLNRWWELGRETSLSPLETAKALGAPILDGVNSNANIKLIVGHLGAVKVRYGLVSIDQKEIEEAVNEDEDLYTCTSTTSADQETVSTERRLLLTRTTVGERLVNGQLIRR